MTRDEATRLAIECLRAHSMGLAGVYGEAADVLADSKMGAIRYALKRGAFFCCPHCDDGTCLACAHATAELRSLVQ